VNVVSKYMGYNQPYTVLAGRLAVFSVSPISGSKVAFVVSTSAAPGAADIYYTFGSPAPCAANIPIDTQIFSNAGTFTTPGTLSINWVGYETMAQYEAAPQTFRSCRFFLYANPTGAAGTLNAYVHAFDSFTGNEDDLVSFVQVAAVASRQAAQISFEPNVNPHTVSLRALAVGTLQPGISSDKLTLSYVVAGAGASYDVKLVGICH
jgi:hypothetical protein